MRIVVVSTEVPSHEASNSGFIHSLSKNCTIRSPTMTQWREMLSFVQRAGVTIVREVVRMVESTQAIGEILLKSRGWL